MAEDDGQEKTEDPTPRKRQKSREDGQVAKSIELVSVAILFFAVAALNLASGFIYSNMEKIFNDSLNFGIVTDPTTKSFLFSFYAVVKYSAMAMAPVLLAVFLAALFSNLFQVGFFVSWKAIEPKGSKINPIKGFGRLFSMKSLFDLVKSILKITIIFSLAYFAVIADEENLLRLYDNDVANIFLFLMKISFRIFVWILIVMTILAVMDYLYQKWDFEQKIKMSKQEVKDEMKQTEGDPHVKSRIRQLQAEAARNRMMSEVPKADVVITNPTHIAVALRYDQMNMSAPKVLAKGAGRIAERIKEIATREKIPIVEQPQLARNLFKIVDIGEQIPSEFFQAVAEILAKVYNMKGNA
ncbi:MAG: flagellar biosynthesis protein FlhB [Desulfobacteraceae bacterium]|nr:flagellar biosynthesis protein FlhB [Desulfobacteraceae bacterium]